MKILTLNKVPVFIFLQIIIWTVVAADTTPVKVPISPPMTKDTSANQKVILSESEAYKLLYENAKENNERMVSTIQWVIGISVAFLLAIFGSQIFFNWRLNKQEIDNITSSIDKKILTMKSDLTGSMEEKAKESQAAIDKKLTDVATQINSDIKEKFKSRMDILNLKSDLIDSKVENATKQLKINVERLEGDVWKLKGVESNALSSYIRTAFLEVEAKRELKYTLNDIISLLTKLEEIHQVDYQRLDELMDKLTPIYDGQKKEIMSLYRDKPVYRFVERPYVGGMNLSQIGSLVGAGYSGFSGLSGKEYVKNKPTK